MTVVEMTIVIVVNAPVVRKRHVIHMTHVVTKIQTQESAAVPVGQEFVVVSLVSLLLFSVLNAVQMIKISIPASFQSSF